MAYGERLQTSGYGRGFGVCFLRRLGSFSSRSRSMMKATVSKNSNDRIPSLLHHGGGPRRISMILGSLSLSPMLPSTDLHSSLGIA